MLIDDNRMSRSMLPEFISYYITGLAWLRIVSLKDLQRYNLTPAETDLQRVLGSQAFSIPEPISVYLKQYGFVVPPTDSRLSAVFPDLPTAVINNNGGYYGPLGVDTHNLYEEIPTLGVTAEAIRQAIGNAPVGPYNSALTTDALTTSENLLGWRPLGIRHAEAKDKAIQCGFTQHNVRELIPHTGLNLPMMMYVSGYFARSPTFKCTTVTVHSFGIGGTTAQIVNCRPLTPNEPAHSLIGIEYQAKTMFRESPLHTGLGLFTGTQVWKTTTAGQPFTNWSCAIQNDGTVPPDWVANANDRRNNTPDEFIIDRFTATSYTMTDYIRQVVNRLVISKR